jgi:hypothetical protein
MLVFTKAIAGINDVNSNFSAVEEHLSSTSSTSNYKIQEEAWNARTFVSGSEDSITRVDQNAQAFWTRVSKA